VDDIRPFRFDDESSPPDTALDTPEQQPNRRWMVIRQSNVWTPPTDVYELDDRLVVCIEIAGMRDGDFNVALQDRRLTVSGTRNRPAREILAFQQMEIRYGEFRSEVTLPWLIDRDHVSALYRDGFLWVELPRASNQQIRIVDVEQESDV
jgi:HSP20 family protein